jgi:hypothetical protein
LELVALRITNGMPRVSTISGCSTTGLRARRSHHLQSEKTKPCKNVLQITSAHPDNVQSN